jgi:hypothetical protein
MTHEQLIAKAIEEAERYGVPPEILQDPKLREAVRIKFRSRESKGDAEFYLDRTTGEVLSGTFSGFERKPSGTGKQFSKTAQEVLALASDESRRMGCEHVGSDHFLRGALSYGKGIGVTVLLSAGLSAEAVRSRLASVGSAPEDAPTGYGPSMRSVLRSAVRYTDSLQHTEVEPEHLILGLLDETDGGARNMFVHFGIDTVEMKRKLLQKLDEEE